MDINNSEDYAILAPRGIWVSFDEVARHTGIPRETVASVLGAAKDDDVLDRLEEMAADACCQVVIDAWARSAGTGAVYGHEPNALGQEWLLTDPDSFQWQRELPPDRGPVFEMVQVVHDAASTTYKYGAFEERVALADLPFSDLERVAGYYYSAGDVYGSALEALADANGAPGARYGDDDYPYFVLAECVFEEHVAEGEVVPIAWFPTAEAACRCLDREFLGDAHARDYVDHVGTTLIRHTPDPHVAGPRR